MARLRYQIDRKFKHAQEKVQKQKSSLAVKHIQSLKSYQQLSTEISQQLYHSSYKNPYSPQMKVLIDSTPSFQREAK